MEKPELPLFAILVDNLGMSQRQRLAAARLLRRSKEEIAAEADAARLLLREPQQQVYLVASRDPVSPSSFGADCIWATDVENAMRRTEKHRRQEGEYAVDAQDLVDLADSIRQLMHHAKNVTPGEEDDNY